MKFKFFGCLALAITFTSCGNVESDANSSLDYLLLGEGQEGLLLRKDNPTINICLYGDDANKESMKKKIEDSISMWYNVVEDKAITCDLGESCDESNIEMDREIKTYEWTTGTKESCTVDGRGIWAKEAYDIAVEVTNEVHAHCYPGKRPTIHIESKGYMGSWGTVAHEIAHAFGLDDTYTATGACKSGQPDESMMCKPYTYKTPTQDDISGIQALLKRLGSKPEALLPEIPMDQVQKIHSRTPAK